MIGGGGGGGTVGVSHVYHNRDLLNDGHARRDKCPWCPLVPLPMHIFQKKTNY